MTKETPKETAKADAKPVAKTATKKSASSSVEVQASTPVSVVAANTQARFADVYAKVVRPALMKQFGYKNLFEVPKIEKIVVNMGVGEAVNDNKTVKMAAEELALITGQKAVPTRARKSIATFKVRENMVLGCKVTLRNTRMYEFLDRLITIALPRVRDFRGVSGKSFDGRGNYAIGLKEQLIFPEINYDKIDAIRGMDIVFVTTAKTDAEAKALLKAFGMPFNS